MIPKRGTDAKSRWKESNRDRGYRRPRHVALVTGRRERRSEEIESVYSFRRLERIEETETLCRWRCRRGVDGGLTLLRGPRAMRRSTFAIASALGSTAMDCSGRTVTAAASAACATYRRGGA